MASSSANKSHYVQIIKIGPAVSERPRSTVPVRLLCPGRRCWHSATAAFQQPSTTNSTLLPAHHLRSPGIFTCRSHGLKISQILSGTWPSVQRVSDVCLRRVCLLDTSAFSALQVLDDYCAI